MRLDTVVLRPKGPLDRHHMAPHFFSAPGTRKEATNAPPLGILAQISLQKRTHKREFRTYGDGEIILSLLGSGRSRLPGA